MGLILLSIYHIETNLISAYPTMSILWQWLVVDIYVGL